MSKKFEWWQKTVVYQIYPRSYMDSSGNGIGDLQGIINKLDYIKDLGVETIWFSPFYPSPTDKPYKEHDCGYDISDYRNINPEYGTMELTERLIKEIHERDMCIVLDMVMNHTSSEHEWFKESRSSRDNPKRDWYIWRDGKKPNGKKPPNNWKAFIGRAWQYDEQTDQWYYRAFLPFQPDLNYRNPEVQKEMLDTVRFWLKKGIDGYRLDIINALFEDPTFKNSKFVFKIFTEDMDMLFRSSKPVLNQPDTLEFCKVLRATIDEFPAKFMVGEVAAALPTLRKYLGDINSDGHSNNGLNQIFVFKSMTTPFKPVKLRKVIKLYEKWFPYPLSPTYVFGNHDQSRRFSRLNNSLDKAKLNVIFQLTARGVPYIYYGEEIGMQNLKVSKKDSKDAVSWAYYWIPEFIRNILLKRGGMINRDGCRTPMQWDGSENAGFSPAGVDTWLPVHPNHININVESEEKDIDSLLNCYKRLLKLRNETISLQEGEIKIIKLKKFKKNCLAYQRIHESEDDIFVYMNFSKNPLIINPLELKSSPILLFSTLSNRKEVDIEDYDGNLYLTPYEGVIFK